MMADSRSVIERGLARAGSESYTLDSFYRRRDRKRARKRLTAGIVGLAIAIAMVVAGSAILRSAPEDKDVGRKGPQILREGEVLQVVDEFGAWSLVATDPTTGHQRILQGCLGDCRGAIVEFALSAHGGWIGWEQICGGGCAPPGTEVGGLWVVGADGTTIRLTPSVPAPGPYPNAGQVWAWSTATEQLAFVTGRPGFAELTLLDPATGERTSVTTVDKIAALSWSPDGAAIAIASPSSGVSIIDLATGRSTSIARTGTGDDLSWSPDGTRLVLATTQGIIVVRADGSDQRVLVEDGLLPAWSPDGTSIAYLRQHPGSVPPAPGLRDPWHRVSLEAWVIGADGFDATRLFHGDCCIADWSGPVWSPDGSRIAFWDNVDVPFESQLVVNADGTGSPEEVDDVVVDGWIQG
jgi:hypothetical protein